jgi:hypothetical protein
MNDNRDPHVRGSTMSRFRLRLSAGALIAVTAAILAVPTAAPAVIRTVDYGQPGRAQMPAVRGWWNPNGGTLRVPSRHVSRTSPRQSPQTQTICAEYRLYKFTASYYEEPWAFQDSRRSCVHAAARHRAVFPTWNYSALAYSSYSLSVEVTWRLEGGSPLSRAEYDYNLVKDYRCQTGNCTSAIRYKGVGSIRFDS